MNITQPFHIVFLVGFVAYVAIRGVYARRAKREVRIHRQIDGQEKLLLVLVILGSVLIPVLYLFTPWLRFADYHLSAVARWSGLVVMLAALWLFWRSHADLGRNWSISLELRRDHCLVTDGVYRWVRHPMYAAIWLWSIAQALLLENWLAGWSSLAPFAAMYFLRTPREERMLCEFFGAEYSKYMQRTGRLWPRLRGRLPASAAPVVAMGFVFAGVWHADAADAQPPRGRAMTLATEIDRQIAQRWDESSVTPAPLADDAEFLRRVWLDIAGKLPPPSNVREFLADERPGKRGMAIDELLDSPGYVTHFAAYWRDVLMPEAGVDGELQQFVPAFELWLQRHVVRGTAFDRVVYEVLTAPLVAPQSANVQRSDLPVASALPFFAAKQISAENLAAATSRAFLGIRVECAQCHDHPFDRWKQQEFWGFASFFGGLQRLGTGAQAPVREVFDRREMMIPNTQTIVQAAYLDGTNPQWRPREGARQTLARWIASPDNPYFARATANRLWGHFLGYGLVDPLDDFSEHNPPSHPQLLDELAQNLIRENFDLKFLMRAITSSHTYQLSSRQTDATQSDPRLFARMPVRGLSPHQVRRVFGQATGFDAEQNQLLRLLGADRPAPPEQEVGVLWALAMMNGAGTSGASHPDNGPVLSAIINFPMNDDERIDALYLATLSRFPTERERLRLRDHIESNGPPHDRAFADIYWQLLNSSEFFVNH